MNRIEVTEMHAITLEIAMCFHKICENLNIPYYMLGGTMLGAVRHKGFIPWDDDMDFGIPRKYFNEFIEKSKHLLPEYYKLITSEDYEYEINYDTVKIVDNRYTIKELERENLGVEMGLFIDIFPLDETNNKWSVLSRNKVVSCLLCWNSYKYKALLDKSEKKLKWIAFIVRLLPHDVLKKVAHLLLKKDGTHYSNYGGFWGSKETISKVIFGTPELYSFENTSFYGVHDYNGYLQSLYGDYMQLPPEEKRHSHIIQCCKK